MKVRAIATLAPLAGIAAAVSMPWRMSSPTGDARLDGPVRTYGLDGKANVQFGVTLPPGRHQAFTAVAWLRIFPPAGTGGMRTTYLTTTAFWCGDPIQRSNPDVAAGAFGFDAGTNLTTAGGAISIGSFPWQPYADSELSNKWPKGVYTIAGWSSNAVTVALGGSDVVVGPGTFNRDAEPGPADSVVVSGAGLAAIGISRTPGHRFFGEIDGVTDEETDLLTPESTVTNEFAMCVWRFKIEGTNQVYKSDLGTVAAFDKLSQWKTNDAPCCLAFDSTGYYRVGLTGLGYGAGTPVEHDIWGGRVFPWWLSDAELERIHANQVEELQRRAIPITREATP